MRRTLIVVVVSMGLVVVAALVAVPIFIQRNLSVAAVEERATQLAAREVTVESVGITFRPGLRIRMEGVSIAGGESAEAVEIEIAILPLLQGRIEPAELHLQSPRLLADRDANGRISMRLLHRGESDETTSSGFPPLPALEASDGEIIILDPGQKRGGGAKLRILRLEQGRLGQEGPVPTKFHLALDPGEGSDFSFEEARFAAFLERVDGEVRVTSGRLDGKGLVLKKLRFPHFEGRFEYAKGRVDLEGLEVTGYDGSASLDGRIATARPVRFEGDLRLEGLALPAMIEDWRGEAPRAVPQTLDLDGRVSLRLGGGLGGSGSGSISIRGGTLQSGSLFSVLLGSIGTLSGQILSLGSAGDTAPSQVERIEAAWELRGDRLHSDALVVVTDDYRYAATGSLGLDQSLAFKGKLQLTSRGVQRMVASAALPLPTATAVIPTFPVDVGGRLGAPKFTAKLSGLTGVARSSLTGLVGGGAGVVKGAARAGGGAIGRIFGRKPREEAEAEEPEGQLR